jgi:hypothetical protein
VFSKAGSRGGASVEWRSSMAITGRGNSCQPTVLKTHLNVP